MPRALHRRGGKALKYPNGLWVWFKAAEKTESERRKKPARAPGAALPRPILGELLKEPRAFIGTREDVMMLEHKDIELLADVTSSRGRAHSRPLPAPGPSFSSGPPTASHLLQILPILRGGRPPAPLSEHLPLGGGHSPDPLHMCSPWRHTTDARGVSGPLRHQDRPHVPQRPVSWSVGVWHTLRMKRLCFLLITFCWLEAHLAGSGDADAGKSQTHARKHPHGQAACGRPACVTWVLPPGADAHACQPECSTETSREIVMHEVATGAFS
ncbi:uncharacterized protein LOC103676002 isoform X5 [Ursus maritimus]|uniref:Uncharacterized protein LOC103676002 isoform X5 n=1 Tax=Ursus maritimus TaxID=29073 RepID=A0A8M1F985_URSMA|nr:uncharacterized protein LOC103676002 isoform X5 [Ursus maritimus]